MAAYFSVHHAKVAGREGHELVSPVWLARDVVR
jgi:hypothetical protein